MEKIKILHCSDFHFDTPFKEYDKNIAEIRKEDIRETFIKIVALAREENAKIILISGDVFDNSTVTYETITLLKKSFENIPEIRIFISPGNHDPYSCKSYYNSTQWPSNVHIFGDLIEKIDIDEYNLSVYGCGFGNNYVRDSILKGFKVEDPSKINIMILHGEVVSSNSISDYNPVTEEQIRSSGLDYLALGHVHTYSGVNKSGNTYWSYPGCPEGRGFDELGPKGVILGDIGKAFADLSFLELCKRRQELLEVDISGSENYEDIILKINMTLGLHNTDNDIREIQYNLRRDMYKVILKGSIEKDFSINKEILKEKLRDYFFFAKLKDTTEVKIDYEALSKEYSIKGIFVSKMLERIAAAENETEKDKIKTALKMGLEALDYREVRIDEN